MKSIFEGATRYFEREKQVIRFLKSIKPSSSIKHQLPSSRRPTFLSKDWIRPYIKSQMLNPSDKEITASQNSIFIILADTAFKHTFSSSPQDLRHILTLGKLRRASQSSAHLKIIFPKFNPFHAFFTDQGTSLFGHF